MNTDYSEINKEQAIALGYNDLALAVIKASVKENEKYLDTESGLFWKQVFILSDEIFSGYNGDSHLSRMEQPNLDEE